MNVDPSAPPHEAAGRRRRAACLAACVLAAVLAATLFPFELRPDELPERLAGGPAGLLLSKPSGPLDWLGNGLLFVPLGWAAALLAATRGRAPRWARIAAGAAGLSVLIEAVQVLLPTRSSHAADVIANGIGAAVGALLQRRLPGGGLLSAWAAAERAALRVPTTALLSGAALWLAAGLLASATLQRRALPSDWDPAFHLVLGNEATGDRPWEGRLARLRFYDRALSDAEARLATAADAPRTIAPDALFAAYDLTDADGLADATTTLPALGWHGAPSPCHPQHGAPLAADGWLISDRPVEALAALAGRRGRFSVEVTAWPEALDQTGPARLLSVSRDPWASNLTLGQEADALVVRVRSPHTGPSGTEPPLVAPGVFTAARPVHLAVTYDGGNLRLYVDGRRHPRGLSLGPGTALAALAPPVRPEWITGHAVIFQALLFLPLGAALACARARAGWAVLPLGTVLPAMLQEAILLGVSGRTLSPGSLLLALALTAFPPALAGWRR